MGGHPEFPTREATEPFRILLSHTPDNYPWARANAVDLMLSGHNHGGQIRLPLFGAIHTPSSFGTKYAGGTFWEAPTLLHVSRGVSGRHPWRWNCLPELTRLVLRSEMILTEAHSQRSRAI
jgi:predicted MPP superfamily phosphohydrolase